MKLVAGGANGSRGALDISGEILPAFAYPWAGASFNPGPSPMHPANLSDMARGEHDDGASIPDDVR